MLGRSAMRPRYRSLAIAVSLLAVASVSGQSRPPAESTSFQRPSAAPTAKPGATGRPTRANAAPPTTLELNVVDPSGAPVEGAFALATPAVGAYVGLQLQADKLRSGVTGRDGRIRLERMPKGPWGVTVRARGFVPRHEQRVSVTTLTVRLAKGDVVTGVVRDGATQAPVPGARLIVDEGMPLAGEWEDRLSRNEATADAKGVFRLEGIGRTLVGLVVRAAGYAPARRAGVRAGSRVEIFLFPGPTLAGTVRDEAGKPLAGASVRLFAEGWSTPPPVDPTDAAGRFTAAGVEPGEYWVVARAGARAPGLARVAVTARDDATVELTVGDGGYATGRVVDAASRPLAEASLRPDVLEGRGLPTTVTDGLAATSNADGAFVLGPLPSGAVQITIAHRGHAATRVPATVVPRQSTDLRDVVLEAGLAIRGRVSERGGAGLAGVLVRAEPRGGGEGSTADAESDAVGAFVLSGLPAGAYSVSAQAAGFATSRTSASAGGEPVELVMDAGGTVVGRVVDAAGVAVSGARVELESSDADGPTGRTYVHGSSGEEGDGRFTIRDAAPGTYALRARAAESGEAALSGVKVLAARMTDVGTLSLSVSGRVTGVVVDAAGEPVPGATVRVRRNAQVQRGDDPTAETDSSGTFEARGVRPGRVEVVASHPSFVTGRATDVDVDPEKEPPTVRIVLTRGGRLEGRAVRRDGRPFEDGRVSVSPTSGNQGFTAEPAPTLPDGSFVVDHVPAGRAMVYLMTRIASSPSISGPRGMVTLAGVASREVEVREGETTAVDIATREVVVAGRVTRGGQGLTGVVVNVIGRDSGTIMGFAGLAGSFVAPSSGPPPLSATTREDGSFELLAFGPGRSYVQLRSPERLAFPGREVDIPDAESYRLDIDVGEASVTGVVVEKETGAPIAEAQVGLREPGADGAWKGGAASGPDGRFTIAAEPGDYVLVSSARTRRTATMPVSVAASGPADVRLEMEAGLEIRGRVVDAAGRPVPDVRVYPVDSDGNLPRLSSADGRTLPDGTFRLGELDERPYALVCGEGSAGFGMRPAVVPGAEAVTVALRPGGRLLVRVLGPDGAPARDVYPRVVGWDGLHARGLPLGETKGGEEPGTFELVVPSGAIEIAAGWPKPLGTATARVAPNETASADLVLREMPPR